MVENKDVCDHCRSSQFTQLYKVPTSQRGISVYLCQTCGLVQSLPRVDSIPTREVAVTSGANWGNVRYGKGFRTEVAFDLLQKTIDLSQVKNCLDVGANRGSFVLKLHELVPNANILAVEPDSKVIQDYADHSEIEVVNKRIEETPLPKEHFDLVYCSHTLEHVHSPAAVLKQIYDTIAENGLLFMEVPNIAFIGQENVVEEWFIDKHLYHYSPETLIADLEAAGFDCPATQIVSDVVNVSVIAVKREPTTPTLIDITQVKESEKKLITQYKNNLVRNHQQLKQAANHIEKLVSKGKRIVFWGAGRIFDSLVINGGLSPQAITGLVDKRLPQFVKEMHGLPLQYPEEIGSFSPDLVVITSREYYEEIHDELKNLLPECTSISFADLLEGTFIEI